VNSLLIYIPFIISFLIGYVILQTLFLKSNRSCGAFDLLIAMGLGLAVSAYLTFSSFIFLNRFVTAYVIGLNILVLLAAGGNYLMVCRRYKKQPSFVPPITREGIIFLSVTLVLFGPVLYWANFFAFGGWDAWSTWNLKAKTLFMGGEYWQNIFSPILWRSSPHYPLLLPLINVWGWSFVKEPLYQGPLFTSLLFGFLTLYIMFVGIKRLTGSWFGFIPVAILLTLPYYMKIFASQYCDIVVSFFLCGSMLTMILAKKEKSQTYALLSGANLGILTFTKPEGLVAAFILVTVSSFYLLNIQETSWKKRLSLWLPLLGGFIVILIPTVIFHLFYAPENQTMINGLQSALHPSTLNRLKFTLSFYVVELASYYYADGKVISNWNGIWIVLLIGLFLSKGKCFKRELLIFPVFIFCYLSVITAYYYVNTYFEIGWWLQVTVHRIFFSLLPVLIVWTFCSLWQENRNA
jgi:hypothetical protein